MRIIGRLARCVKIAFCQMFSLKLSTILLTVALSAMACRFWQAKPNDAPAPTPVIIEEIKSQIPFTTKEPEIFQAEIVVTANGSENKIFTTRNGADRVTIYDYQTPYEIAFLQTGAGGSFTINRGQKIYVENQTTNSGEDEIFPVAELVNQHENAAFEKLSDENGTAKYRVTLDASNSAEIVVTVDESINLPIKQEFFSVNGEQKTLLTTTELRNFTTQIDRQNFEPPKDYKKVSLAEFQQNMRRARQN